MKVYEVKCTFYVAAMNDVDARDMFDNVIAPYAPGSSDLDTDPVIESMYFDTVKETDYLPDSAIARE